MTTNLNMYDSHIKEIEDWVRKYDVASFGGGYLEQSSKPVYNNNSANINNIEIKKMAKVSVVSGIIDPGVKNSSPFIDKRLIQSFESVKENVSEVINKNGELKPVFHGFAYSPSVISANDKFTSISSAGFDVNKIRADFPILSEKVNGHNLVWFDNGATTQKPRQVIDRFKYFYEHENSNIHRGAHELAARATDAYEKTRKITADFLGAPSSDNIVFVRGTTEGINLVAQSYVKPLLKQGDEIILTMLEHHANIVPWQLIAEETGALINIEYTRIFTNNNSR